jgi:hypothetical protein
VRSILIAAEVNCNRNVAAVKINNRWEIIIDHGETVLNTDLINLVKIKCTEMSETDTQQDRRHRTTIRCGGGQVGRTDGVPG